VLHRPRPRPLMLGLIFGLAAATALAGATRAKAEAQLLIEASTGKVLHAENATYPWYPASVTKLMTAYTTLRAIREGRISFNTLLTVSQRGGPAADQNGLQSRHPGHRR
jgi:D-alanyl-D-alanine carboxypeptidase